MIPNYFSGKIPDIGYAKSVLLLYKHKPSLL